MLCAAVVSIIARQFADNVERKKDVCDDCHSAWTAFLMT